MTDSRRPYDAVQPEPIDDNEDRMGSVHELDFDEDEPSAGSVTRFRTRTRATDAQSARA
jgi:hypothetical protein